MKSLQPLSDKVAISLSGLCTLHCLALPLVVVLLPAGLALPLESEAFHIAMIVAVIPVSVYALTLGCRHHQRYQLLAMGALGLLCLLAALMFEYALGDIGEKALTIVGTAVIAFAHVRNHRLCKKTQASCTC